MSKSYTSYRLCYLLKVSSHTPGTLLSFYKMFSPTNPLKKSVRTISKSVYPIKRKNYVIHMCVYMYMKWKQNETWAYLLRCFYIVENINCWVIDRKQLMKNIFKRKRRKSNGISIYQPFSFSSFISGCHIYCEMKFYIKLWVSFIPTPPILISSLGTISRFFPFFSNRHSYI